jgi:cytochrome c553
MIARTAVLVVALAGSMSALAQDPTHLRLLASNCANCHGTDGHSQGGMPALSGQPKAKLVEMLQDFKAGRKPATIMHQIAKGYSDAELDAVAGYFAAQKP